MPSSLLLRRLVAGTILLLACSLTGAMAAPSPLDTLRPPDRALKQGINCYRRGAFDSATVLLNKALRLARAAAPTPDTLTLLRAYNNLGNVAADQGRKPQALAFYLQSLALAEASHNRANAAKTGNNIGTLYQNWNRLDEALRYFERAENEARQLHDATLLAECNNNFGLVYEQRRQFDRARVAYQQALQYYEQANVPAKIAMVLSNLAIVQKRQNDYPASLASTRRALAIARQTGDQWLAAATLNNLGSTLIETHQPADALPYLQQSLALARHIQAPELVVAALETLAQAAAAAGNYPAAYRYQQRFAAQKDSLISVETHRQLSELQVKYDTQQKERENEQLRYDNRLRTLAQQKAEQDRQRTVQLAGGGTLALLLLGVAGGYYQRQRRRHRETQNLNQALFEGEQQERVRLARDLHDGVGQHLAVVRMYMSVLAEGGPDAAEQAALTLELVDNTIREVRAVSHNLIPAELSFGLLPALRELGRQIGQGGRLRLTLETDPDLPADALPREVELPLYRAVQEVVNGMVRHAEASEIRIRCFRQAGSFVVQLQDDGRGFDPRQLTESAGMGWKNLRARTHLLGGDFAVDSRPGHGTRVRISVPG